MSDGEMTNISTERLEEMRRLVGEITVGEEPDEALENLEKLIDNEIAYRSIDKGEVVKTQWETSKVAGEVAVHSLVVGGVLCRWWGDKEPEGVSQINAALVSQPAPKGVEITDQMVERLAVSVFDQTSDNDTVPWERQPGRVRNQTRKQVRQVLTALRIHARAALEAMKEA